MGRQTWFASDFITNPIDKNIGIVLHLPLSNDIDVYSV